MATTWLHTMDGQGLTPLDRAFKSGHMAISEMMLLQERDDDQGATDKWTPLHRAAYMGLKDAVTSLLTYGADPNASDEEGETPLHKVVRAGHYTAAEVLAGVSNVNRPNSVGLTPLHWACLAGNIEMARLLLSYGADPWIRNEHMDGLSPIELAKIMDYDELQTTLEKREAVA